MSRKDHMVLVNQPGCQFKARLPDDLHSRIKAAAKANNRSANAELVSRLEASFEADQQLAPVIAAAVNDYINAEVSRRLRAVASQMGRVEP